MSSLFLISRAMFLRAVATAHTTLSLSILNNSTRMGSPFSLRTAARMYTDHWKEKKRKLNTEKLVAVVEMQRLEKWLRWGHLSGAQYCGVNTSQGKNVVNKSTPQIKN